VIILTEVILAAIVLLVAIGVGSSARESFSTWALRRRRGRRSALERRMRARAQCTACGAIAQVEFHDRARELLRELGETDAGRTVIALAEYGRRAARPDAS
jgi:hypothetical protein